MQAVNIYDKTECIMSILLSCPLSLPTKFFLFTTLVAILDLILETFLKLSSFLWNFVIVTMK